MAGGRGCARGRAVHGTELCRGRAQGRPPSYPSGRGPGTERDEERLHPCTDSPGPGRSGAAGSRDVKIRARTLPSAAAPPAEADAGLATGRQRCVSTELCRHSAIPTPCSVLGTPRFSTNPKGCGSGRRQSLHWNRALRLNASVHSHRHLCCIRTS